MKTYLLVRKNISVQDTQYQFNWLFCKSIKKLFTHKATSIHLKTRKEQLKNKSHHLCIVEQQIITQKTLHNNFHFTSNQGHELSISVLYMQHICIIWLYY